MLGVVTGWSSGLSEMVPDNLLSIFDEYELEVCNVLVARNLRLILVFPCLCFKSPSRVLCSLCLIFEFSPSSIFSFFVSAFCPNPLHHTHSFSQCRWFEVSHR